MKKRILITLLLVLMLLIVGCTQKAETPSGPFVGGDKGLEIGFVSGEPPDSVFDNNQEDFDITVKVQNSGEFSVPPNKVIATLSGIDAPSFSIANPNVVLRNGLEGTTKTDKNVIKGDEDELRFSNAKYKYPLVADFSTAVRTDVCYLYETKATTKACLKKMATQRAVDDACQITNTNVNVANSGAPVQITNVAERSSGTNRVQLSFTVENKGSGTTYPPDAFTDKCIRDKDLENRLKVTVRTGSSKPVQCSQLDNGNSGEVKLSDNLRPIRCDIDTSGISDNRAFEEPVNIVVDYFYKNAISTPLTVKTSQG